MAMLALVILVSFVRLGAIWTDVTFFSIIVANFVLDRDENGRKRSEEASIVFSFTFFLGNDIDNSIDGNEYGADNTGTSETKLSDRE